MASRAELIQIAQELDIEYEGYSLEELHTLVRETIDKKFNKKYLVTPIGLSTTLLRFMTEEYDYVLQNQEGERFNYKGDPK